jgi:DNA repair/transcription protein MET18/MMS19
MLPFQAPRRTETVERTKCQRILSVLSELCTQPELFEILVIRLLAKLESLRVIPDEATIEANAAYAYSLLTTLFNTLTTKLHKRHTDVSNYSNRLVPRIYALYIGPTLLSDGHFTLGADPRLVGKAAQVVSLVIRTLPLVSVFNCKLMTTLTFDIFREQGKFASALFSAYMTGDTKKIVEGYVEIPTDATFSPFSVILSAPQRLPF